MDYILLFLEGIITFISPCILPMLPIYTSYFAGGFNRETKTSIVLSNALGFVVGFTCIFTLLGTLAGSFGKFLTEYNRELSILSGIILIIIGLNYTGIINIKLLSKSRKLEANIDSLKFFSSIIFGVIFSICWTPCVGSFLGSALMIAANSKEVLKGTLMLLTYSLGLGIPFIFSAILLKELNTAFTFIKKHYKAVNIISGLLLVIIGLFMITGYLNMFLKIFTV